MNLVAAPFIRLIGTFTHDNSPRCIGIRSPLHGEVSVRSCADGFGGLVVAAAPSECWWQPWMGTHYRSNRIRLAYGTWKPGLGQFHSRLGGDNGNLAISHIKAH